MISQRTTMHYLMSQKLIRGTKIIYYELKMAYKRELPDIVTFWLVLETISLMPTFEQNFRIVSGEDKMKVLVEL